MLKNLWVNPPKWLLNIIILSTAIFIGYILIQNQYVKLPGPTANIMTAIRPEPVANSGELLVLTVKQTKLSPFDTFTCIFKADCELTAPANIESSTKDRENADKAAADVAEKDGGSTGWIDLPNILGPSAGLASALGFISAGGSILVPEGSIVAVTGTVDKEGNVGQVGGVNLKAFAAKDAGAYAMLVPVGQGKEVAKELGLEVFEVSTVDDAVRWLCEHGGKGKACLQ